jgi:hypothetical protein
MAPLDYFDHKIADMEFFYTWLDHIGQHNKFFFLIKKKRKFQKERSREDYFWRIRKKLFVEFCRKKQL